MASVQYNYVSRATRELGSEGTTFQQIQPSQGSASERGGTYCVNGSHASLVSSPDVLHCLSAPAPTHASLRSAGVSAMAPIPNMERD